MSLVPNDLNYGGRHVYQPVSCCITSERALGDVMAAGTGSVFGHKNLTPADFF